jgi:hypothetical protein
MYIDSQITHPKSKLKEIHRLNIPRAVFLRQETNSYQLLPLVLPSSHPRCIPVPIPTPPLCLAPMSEYDGGGNAGMSVVRDSDSRCVIGGIPWLADEAGGELGEVTRISRRPPLPPNPFCMPVELRSSNGVGATAKCWPISSGIARSISARCEFGSLCRLMRI